MKSTRRTAAALAAGLISFAALQPCSAQDSNAKPAAKKGAEMDDKTEHKPIIVRQAELLKSLAKANRSVGVRNIRKTDILRINLVEIKGPIRLHRHPDAAHSVMVIEGRVHFIVGKKQLLLEKGDFLEIPKNVPHKCWPEGKRALFVSMDAPYYDPAKTVPLE